MTSIEVQTALKQSLPAKRELYVVCGGFWQWWRLIYLGMVTYMVEGLCYKPEGPGFQSRLDHRIFFILPNPSSPTMVLGLLSL
jgi:hypothetical protein